MFKPNQHERVFGLKPIGVAYKCEFCNDGEMVVDTSQPMLTTYPSLIPHKCTKCGKTMHLTKSYPYIEWVREGDELYDTD